MAPTGYIYPPGADPMRAPRRGRLWPSVASEEVGWRAAPGDRLVVRPARPVREHDGEALPRCGRFGHVETRSRLWWVDRVRGRRNIIPSTGLLLNPVSRVNVQAIRCFALSFSIGSPSGFRVFRMPVNTSQV